MLMKSNMKNKKFVRFFKWIWQRPVIEKLKGHFKEFPYIWIGLLLLFTAALVGSGIKGWYFGVTLFGISLSLMVALILIRPMNAVYGLMGASGDIRLFFFNFVLITLVFAGIYQIGFFRNAGISYDVNQPHIYFNLFQDAPNEDTVIWSEPSIEKVVEKTNLAEMAYDTIYREVRGKLFYQKINFGFTWRNTILTALMQEPAEFFSIASTANHSMNTENGAKLDEQKATMFHLILIFQILISWIFFGVFISLLYNKFRYES